MLAFHALRFPRISKKWSNKLNKLISSMDISPGFILIQKQISEACTIECFIESNENSSGRNRSYTGLVFFCLPCYFFTQKMRKTWWKILVIGGHKKIGELVFFNLLVLFQVVKYVFIHFSPSTVTLTPFFTILCKLNKTFKF